MGDFPLQGHHKDFDIKEEDMDDEMKELHEMMDEAEEVKSEGDEAITDDFISMLNSNLPALIKKEDKEEPEEAP